MKLKGFELANLSLNWMTQDPNRQRLFLGSSAWSHTARLNRLPGISDRMTDFWSCVNCDFAIIQTSSLSSVIRSMTENCKAIWKGREMGATQLSCWKASGWTKSILCCVIHLFEAVGSVRSCKCNILVVHLIMKGSTCSEICSHWKFYMSVDGKGKSCQFLHLRHPVTTSAIRFWDSPNESRFSFPNNGVVWKHI